MPRIARTFTLDLDLSNRLDDLLNQPQSLARLFPTPETLIDDLTPADYVRFYALLPPAPSPTKPRPKTALVNWAANLNARAYTLEALSREITAHFQTDEKRLQAIWKDIKDTRKTNQRIKLQSNFSRVVEALLTLGLGNLKTEGPNATPPVRRSKR